ncbi:MAG: 50S ribosomal protein L4 [Clostridiales bacterium]|nr:50S ribosomal protein L4 [Clostridiales bacterium]
MPNIAVVDMHGKNVGSMELNDDVFAVEVNVPAMHLVVRSYLAAQRQGTQSALTRGMVRGGGRKIYRQKGTGNARHHGNRAPQFRHGGVVFAPQPRDYVVKVPKKVRRLAMKSALTSKLSDMIVVDKIELAEAKTKLVAGMMKELGAEKKTLLVLPGKEDTVVRASKNIPYVKDAYVNTINVYDLLNADKIVVTKDALVSIQEVYA